MTVPNIKLNNGIEIPQLGYGVFQIPPDKTAEAVAGALEVGYRHIDTAEMYRNEQGVGEGVRRSGIDRSEIFVTSKLNNGYHDPKKAVAAFDETLKTLGFDYVDLFLIHWPLPDVLDYVETWKALEGIYHAGKARSIGVSNFQIPHLERLLKETDVVPVVNQIEVHPEMTQEPLRAFGVSKGIATEAWSPIAQGKILDNPTIGSIAKKIGKTPAQVVLRWHIQRGDIVFPKSVTPSRVKENFELFDFSLSNDDVAAISALNKDARIGPNPDEFNWIPD